MKQDLNDKKNVLLSNYKDLETEVERQEDIISSEKNKCVFRGSFDFLFRKTGKNNNGVQVLQARR